ncbi:hypothetical protein ACM25P_01450 [Vreelandella alkaliphila]|uniref:hypothetical protein n=1 Tax=Vreelandella alkaliphila TaxID=272774 RepID=UPI0025861C9E|nr:hypothetical protein [Halomonas sp.]MCD6438187.1 hypothetical protein [Halomonas sp.]
MPPQDICLDRLDSLMEDKDMLAENLENLVKKERLEGRQEGEQSGIQKGRLAEAREVVRTQLTFKFGEVPDWVEAQLVQADHDQLKGWMRDVLFANRLDDMFKR